MVGFLFWLASAFVVLVPYRIRRITSDVSRIDAPIAQEGSHWVQWIMCGPVTQFSDDSIHGRRMRQVDRHNSGIVITRSKAE